MSEHRHSLSRGYSLMELLTVTAIIGVMSLVTVPAFIKFYWSNKMKASLRQFTSVSLLTGSSCTVTVTWSTNAPQESTARRTTQVSTPPSPPSAAIVVTPVATGRDNPRS